MNSNSILTKTILTLCVSAWRIHLMRMGVIEANLVTLNQDFQLSYIDDLIARKLSGLEKGTLADDDMAFFQQEYARLRGVLEASFQASHLPEAPSCRAALNDLLIRLRLG